MTDWLPMLIRKLQRLQSRNPINHLIEARNREGIKPARILPPGTKENIAKWDGGRMAAGLLGSIGQNGEDFWLWTWAVLPEKGRMALDLMQILLGPPPQISLTLKPQKGKLPRVLRGASPAQQNIVISINIDKIFS